MHLSAKQLKPKDRHARSEPRRSRRLLAFRHSNTSKSITLVRIILVRNIWRVWKARHVLAFGLDPARGAQKSVRGPHFRPPGGNGDLGGLRNGIFSFGPGVFEPQARRTRRRWLGVGGVSRPPRQSLAAVSQACRDNNPGDFAPGGRLSRAGKQTVASRSRPALARLPGAAVSGRTAHAPRFRAQRRMAGVLVAGMRKRPGPPLTFAARHGVRPRGAGCAPNSGLTELPCGS
jgi:hypothetical protein